MSNSADNTPARLAFTLSRAKLTTLADKNPEWFAMAARVLQTYHNGDHQLLAAIMLGLMDAHALGQKGELPEMKAIQKSVEKTFRSLMRTVVRHETQRTTTYATTRIPRSRP